MCLVFAFPEPVFADCCHEDVSAITIFYRKNQHSRVGLVQQLCWKGDFVTVSFAFVHTCIHTCVCICVSVTIHVYISMYLQALYLGRCCQFLQLCLFRHQIFIFVSSLRWLFFQELTSYVSRKSWAVPSSFLAKQLLPPRAFWRPLLRSVSW